MGLEFNNGGKDLEKFVFRNASPALAAWRQVVHSLAVAEEEAQFEHRDLHWGNVLIKETSNKQVWTVFLVFEPVLWIRNDLFRIRIQL